MVGGGGSRMRMMWNNLIIINTLLLFVSGTGVAIRLFEYVRSLSFFLLLGHLVKLSLYSEAPAPRMG